jgi:hypothetical protein
LSSVAHFSIAGNDIIKRYPGTASNATGIDSGDQTAAQQHS